MNDFDQPVRRDRWGRYLVLPLGGHKPVGYTRATTIAKTLSDRSALEAWSQRMTAIGLAKRPDLLAQIDDLVDDKTGLNRLCESAKEAGGATVRRDLGTALHSILERSFRDPDYQPPAAHVDDVAAVHRLLADHNLTVQTDYLERMVVNHGAKIAGTLDLMLKQDDNPNLIISDFKTGSSVQYGGLDFAIQLTIYATADEFYMQGAAADGSQDQREPLPPLEQEYGHIIHIEPGSGIANLHRVTLTPQHLQQALDVRKARNEGKRLISGPLDTPTGRPIVRPYDGPTPEPANTDRDLWIRERIDRIRDTDPERLALRWPADDVPPPKKIDVYTDDHIDLLIPVIDDLEAILEIRFPPSDPKNPRPTPRHTKPFEPVTAEQINMPDEGPIDPASADLLRQRVAELTDPQKQRLTGCVREARNANLPIRVAETPTVRRINIARILLHAIEHDWEFDLMRGMLAGFLKIDSADIDVMPFGAAIALLDATQSAAMRKFVEMGETLTATADEETT